SPLWSPVPALEVVGMASSSFRLFAWRFIQLFEIDNRGRRSFVLASEGNGEPIDGKIGAVDGIDIHAFFSFSLCSIVPRWRGYHGEQDWDFEYISSWGVSPFPILLST